MAATQRYCLQQDSLASKAIRAACPVKTASFEGHESPDNRTTGDRSKCQTRLLAQASTNAITVATFKLTHATTFQDFVQYRSCNRPLQKFTKPIYNRTAYLVVYHCNGPLSIGNGTDACAVSNVGFSMQAWPFSDVFCTEVHCTHSPCEQVITF